ncbi:hypothetical protein RYO59_000393 [Thermosynechococcaceae cyanobacterium Okahandja]
MLITKSWQLPLAIAGHAVVLVMVLVPFLWLSGGFSGTPTTVPNRQPVPGFLPQGRPVAP